jgi:hypothetical protein
MDILWAISHASVAVPGGPLPGALFTGAAAAAGSFAVPTPPYADGSWEMYQDFVGGVQFWGYGLVSGSGDGAVRMWDSERSCLFLSALVPNVVSQCGPGKPTGHYWDIRLP